MKKYIYEVSGFTLKNTIFENELDEESFFSGPTLEEAIKGHYQKKDMWECEECNNSVHERSFGIWEHILKFHDDDELTLIHYKKEIISLKEFMEYESIFNDSKIGFEQVLDKILERRNKQ